MQNGVPFGKRIFTRTVSSKHFQFKLNQTCESKEKGKKHTINDGDYSIIIHPKFVISVFSSF
jgi:hypothetical protein